MKKIFIAIVTLSTILIGCKKENNNIIDNSYTCTCVTTTQPASTTDVSKSTIKANSKSAASEECKQQGYTSPVSATTGKQKIKTCHL